MTSATKRASSIICRPPPSPRMGARFERNTHIKMVHDLLHRIGGLFTGASLFFWGGNCSGVKPPGTTVNWSNPSGPVAAAYIHGHIFVFFQVVVRQNVLLSREDSWLAWYHFCVESACVFCPTPHPGHLLTRLSMRRKAGVARLYRLLDRTFGVKLSCRRSTKFPTLENQRNFDRKK
jgi:hypothetical protein